MEKLGGLYCSLVPLFVIGFSVISAKWKQNSSIKRKLDGQFKQYLGGSQVADNQTGEQFPETLKNR